MQWHSMTFGRPGGGQICRPFLLMLSTARSFQNLSLKLTQRYSYSRPCGRWARAGRNALFLLHTNTQSEFSREFFNTIFARLTPLATAARCGPHPLPPHLPRYAAGSMLIIKFRKVPELFRNRKVRTVRTEQLVMTACTVVDDIVNISA